MVEPGAWLPRHVRPTAPDPWGTLPAKDGSAEKAGGGREVEGILTWTACGLFGASVATDVRWRRVPNAIPIALLLLFAGYALTGAAGPARAVWLCLGIGAVLLAAGFALYLSGRFGAGDAKLIAAAGVWAGPGDLSLFLFGLAGCALALSAFALLPIERLRALRSELPFAVAIAPPAMVVMVARECAQGTQI